MSNETIESAEHPKIARNIETVISELDLPGIALSSISPDDFADFQIRIYFKQEMHGYAIKHLEDRLDMRFAFATAFLGGILAVFYMGGVTKQ